ncbi:MAG: hypothetical protein XD87_0063 [candidate division WS6 bacterium 36_33]|uniref:Uncharacterized protein n=1 Tax=candidate division WS6 bacterium 36_33 TaxID=1641388 RepID=A0A117LU33_9BACT|nr:MAG: hypothetical protein XD87_0063 [candidate division WS6 bacterium 36_33]
MLEKELWLAPPEVEKEKSLEDRWFYHDSLYNLCLQLSYFNSSNSEAYGAVAVQNIGEVPTIIGLGWNMYMGGKTNFKRQGYANHAEFQAAALAESLGYNLSDKQRETCLYVAGRFSKSGNLFFSPNPISFTCVTCTKTIPRYFPNTTLAAPTKNKGWKHIPMEEAYNSSLYFKHQDLNREDITDLDANVTNLNLGFTQEHIDRLVSLIKNKKIKIDERLERKILKNYIKLLNSTATERRNFAEGMIREGYTTLRGSSQGSLYLGN